MADERAPESKPKRAKGKGKKRRAPGKGETSERARASTANGALGRKFAALLEQRDSHQLGVCAQLGIPHSTHMRWMASDAEAGTDLAAYQSAVLLGLDRQRMLDLEQAQEKLDKCHPAKAGAQFNLFKFRHENRFRRFCADETAQKHEVQLTGKDGGPIETESRVRYVVKVPKDEPIDPEVFDQE
jgi:hypothetical protein